VERRATERGGRGSRGVCARRERSHPGCGFPWSYNPAVVESELRNVANEHDMHTIVLGSEFSTIRM